MISRFDHAVIGVRDLDTAMERFRALGFDVGPGGRHTGLGTHNAIIRFGLDYLELLSVFDTAEAASGGRGGPELATFLQEREGGLVGYALATTGIEEDAARMERTSLEAVGPFAMERLRPDGHLLSWRLLVPGGISWRRPWPFLIQWDAPDEQRLSWEKPGTHGNGTNGVAGVAVAVRDLDQAINLYQNQLGISLIGRDSAPLLTASRASFSVGSFRIDLLAPTADGPIQQTLDEVGEGPYELFLSVASLSDAREALARAGVDLVAEDGVLYIPPTELLGTRLALVERPA